MHLMEIVIRDKQKNLLKSLGNLRNGGISGGPLPGLNKACRGGNEGRLYLKGGAADSQKEPRVTREEDCWAQELLQNYYKVKESLYEVTGEHVGGRQLLTNHRKERSPPFKKQRSTPVKYGAHTTLWSQGRVKGGDLTRSLRPVDYYYSRRGKSCHRVIFSNQRGRILYSVPRRGSIHSCEGLSRASPKPQGKSKEWVRNKGLQLGKKGGAWRAQWNPS